MSSSGPSNARARTLLQTLYNLILPLAKMVTEGMIKDAKQIPLGIEADEFVLELEKFISGMIARSQPGSQDVSIDVALQNVEKTPIEGVSNETRNLNRISRRLVLPRQLSGSSNDKDDPKLTNWLEELRAHITQDMPIRLLCFDPRDSKLRITLLDKAGFYNYLAPKFRDDVLAVRKRGFSWWISKHAEYAILSHTWAQTPGELTYGDWRQGLLNSDDPKFRKLVNFCKAAWEDHGLTFGWIDTVCINKESSAELDESIRSMYEWYSNAAVCITYLAGTKQLSDMEFDPWFSRGWTLQELVAPRCIKFYNMDWVPLIRTSSENDKLHPSILTSIELATTITPGELKEIKNTSISRRMQLAAKRNVTREEDTAYCLMGIFNVSISTEYGEGRERAFFRLVREILNSTKDVLDIFNWGGGHPEFFEPITSLFPSIPSDYLTRSSNMQLLPWRPIKPVTLTHLGLRTAILLISAFPSLEVAPAHGDYYATVSIDPSSRQNVTSYKPISFSWDTTVSFGLDTIEIPHSYHLRGSESDDLEDRDSGIAWSVGILNVERRESGILIPRSCLAVLLAQPQDELMNTPVEYHRVYTKQPIVFELKNDQFDANEDTHYYEIDEYDLENHGMKLVTLYL